jgi:hypothetical protein
MGVGFALLFFLALTVLWIALPFVPGVREIVGRGDVRPLQVTRRSEVDVRHFARGFRRYVDARFGSLLARAREARETIAGELPDGGGAYVIVPGGDAEPPLDPAERHDCRRLVLSGGNLRLPADFVHTLEVYAAGDLHGGRRSVYRAGMCEGAAMLGAGSAVLRWLHAGGELVTEPRCLLCGRLSADGDMLIAPGCRFERLHAPRIIFGHEGGMEDGWTAATGGAPGGGERRPLEPDEIPHLIDTRGGRWLVGRRLELPDGAVLANDVVVLGDVVLGDGVRIEGSLKSRRDIRTGRGVVVTGSLIAERDLDLGEESRVAGPLVAERVLSLRRQCVVGSRERPATVSAAVMRIEPGARCHGTVWAHAEGDVLVAARTASAIRAASVGGPEFDPPPPAPRGGARP